MRTINWYDGIVQLNQFVEDNGVLCPIEHYILPFQPKRTFVVSGVPKNDERGHHAHYVTQQILICVQGQIVVKLDDGIEKPKHFPLNNGQAILIPEMVWDSQIYLTGNDVLLSLCSTHYNTKDYILNKDLFYYIKRKQCKK